MTIGKDAGVPAGAEAPARRSERWEDQPVSAVMSTALMTVEPGESVLLAWELLRRSGFHHLPVVDEQGHCLGVLATTELAVACTVTPLLAPDAVSTVLADRPTPSAVCTTRSNARRG